MTDSQLIECETPRLKLRQWCPSDRSPFAALNADPQVMAHFPSVLNQAASDALAARCEALIASRGWGFWALERKDTQTFIGFAGLHIPTTALPFSPCVEIGWRLAANSWGQGLATEAAQAALQIGFNTLDLDEIVSFTAASNIRSHAVMKRLGMQAAGHFNHPDLPANHALSKHCLYRLPRTIWY